MRTVRKYKGSIQVRTLELWSEARQHSITLMGAQHIADPTYWETVNNRLDKFLNRQSKIVHFEGIHPYLGAEPLNSQDLEKIELFQGLANISKKLGGLTGLTFQMDQIKHFFEHPNARRYDLNVVELISGINDKAVKKLRREVKVADEIEEYITPDLMLGLMRLQFGFVPQGLFTAGPLQDIILHRRNEYAVAQAVMERENVVLYWGANHLPGMVKLLKKSGYEIRKSRWDTTIPKNYKAPEATRECGYELRDR